MSLGRTEPPVGTNHGTGVVRRRALRRGGLSPETRPRQHLAALDARQGPKRRIWKSTASACRARATGGTRTARHKSRTPGSESSAASMSGRFPPDPGFTAASGDARASGLTVTPHVIFRNGIVWRRSISLNTVHLMLLRYTRPVVQPGGTNGTNGCGASQWEPDHGLHQPRGVEHDDPADRGERSLGGVESAEYPSTGLARARDGLLRGRVGAVHAVVVPRGLALPAGRPAVVERPVGTPRVVGKSGISQAGRAWVPNRCKPWDSAPRPTP